MADNKTARSRLEFIRDVQLNGGTYEQAVEWWNDADEIADEIADTFLHDGIRTAEDLSDGQIRDAITDYRAIREMGL